MAAMTSFHAKKCCHLVSAYTASAGRIFSSVRQFLIYSTFVYLFYLLRYVMYYFRVVFNRSDSPCCRKFENFAGKQERFRKFVVIKGSKNLGFKHSVLFLFSSILLTFPLPFNRPVRPTYILYTTYTVILTHPLSSPPFPSFPSLPYSITGQCELFFRTI